MGSRQLTSGEKLNMKAVIYSTAICPYCVRAKNFFQKRDIPYEDVMVDMDQDQLRIMMEKSKRQSVPQIFIGDYHVGGFDDLVEHDMDGKLDDLLKD